MAQSSSATSASSRTASFILRILAFALSLISLIVLATNTVIVTDYDYNEAKFRFQDFYAYRYMLATIVIGTAYSLLQLVASICNAISGGEGMLVLAFFGDKFISYVMATGAAAGFGVTVDLSRVTGGTGLDMSNFFEKAYASASLLLLAFICTALLSIISAFALPRRSL
ncbi:PREDICTED: CASP-like protein 4D1 [Fragaria vesca subsp. vesca]|uniref:CASP-like protein 4D1 n=1 Tax=Fragaria vesca subsp. vesca TaxID=101020 RepID=UPI0002C36AEC|nr:PREDICTED: CASP-like protein 4D1 [Fragaria vesca subsp. vesca]